MLGGNWTLPWHGQDFLVLKAWKRAGQRWAVHLFLHCLLVPQDWAVGKRGRMEEEERGREGGERKERRREEGEEERGRREEGRGGNKKFGDCFLSSAQFSHYILQEPGNEISLTNPLTSFHPIPSRFFFLVSSDERVAKSPAFYCLKFKLTVTKQHSYNRKTNSCCLL